MDMGTTDKEILPDSQVNSASSQFPEVKNTDDNHDKSDQNKINKTDTVKEVEGKVELLFTEVKKSVSEQMTEMDSNKIPINIGRKELDGIILKAIIQCMNMDQSKIGVLRSSIIKLEGVKDQLLKKVEILQNQAELFQRVLQVYKDTNDAAKSDSSHLEPQKTRQQPPRLKFFRNVGLQVHLDVGSHSNCNTSITNKTRISRAELDSNSNSGNDPYVQNSRRNKYRSIFNDSGTGPRKQMRMSFPSPGVPSPNSNTSPKKRVNQSNAVVNELRAHAGIGHSLLDSRPPKMARQNQEPNQTELMSNNLHSSFNSYETGGQERHVGEAISGFGSQLIDLTVENTGEGFAAVDKDMTASKNGGDLVQIGKPLSIVPVPVEDFELFLAKRRFTLPILPAQTNVVLTKTESEPPMPSLTLKQQNGEIILSWNHQIAPNFAAISSYQIYCCQEPLNRTQTHTPKWKFVGNIPSMDLPMSCTLTSFRTGDKYHIIMRGIDIYNRSGAFCEPVSIILQKSDA